MTAGQPTDERTTAGQRALADDPWSLDYPARIVLARSCLGHADQRTWRQQIDRALAALEGKSIDEIREGTG